LSAAVNVLLQHREYLLNDPLSGLGKQRADQNRHQMMADDYKGLIAKTEKELEELQDAIDLLLGKEDS
jgi:hypothetical protein